MYLKLLGKQEQTNHKISRRKEIIDMSEINEMEIKRINETLYFWKDK
jgi:hypothetical protein